MSRMANFMSKDDEKILTANIRILIKNMMPSEVLDYLFQEGTFTQRDVDTIRIKPLSEDQNREIVNKLKKKDGSAFKNFIFALMESEQENIAQEIDKHGYVNEWRARRNLPPQPEQLDHPDISTIPSPCTESTSKEELGIQTDAKENCCDILDCKLPKVDTEDQKTKELLKDYEGVYTMNRSKRGRVIIINNEFSNSKNMSRVGSKTDATNLRKLFQELHFDVYEEKNQTAEQIRNLIKDETGDRETNENSNCFIMFVLSHGGHSTTNEDYILGNDVERVYIKREIVAPFFGDCCPSLNGKPKLFFFQACRVISYDEPDSVPSEVETLPKLCQQLSVTEPDVLDKDDVFCIFATIRGHGAPRCTEIGSQFVRQIVQVFSDHAHEWSLLKMMMKVNRRLKENGHISEIHCTSSKELYFFPGFTDDSNALNNE